MDLLGHSAGASLALLYAVRYPDRVSRLALIAPSTRAGHLPWLDDPARLAATIDAFLNSPGAAER
jgi:proline iminopeptidase